MMFDPATEKISDNEIYISCFNEKQMVVATKEKQMVYGYKEYFVNFKKRISKRLTIILTKHYFTKLT